MLQMPLETTWQIDGVWAMPWRWKGLSCFHHGWEGEWLAPKPMRKAFIFINSSLAIKINVYQILWKWWTCFHFRLVSARQLFLLKPVGEILFHYSSSFILSSLSIYRKIWAPPAQPSCSRLSVETHLKKQSLWAVWNTKLTVASLLNSLHLVS